MPGSLESLCKTFSRFSLPCLRSKTLEVLSSVSKRSRSGLSLPTSLLILSGKIKDAHIRMSFKNMTWALLRLKCAVGGSGGENGGGCRVGLLILHQLHQELLFLLDFWHLPAKSSFSLVIFSCCEI